VSHRRGGKGTTYCTLIPLCTGQTARRDEGRPESALFVKGGLKEKTLRDSLSNKQERIQKGLREEGNLAEKKKKKRNSGSDSFIKRARPSNPDELL